TRPGRLGTVPLSFANDPLFAPAAAADGPPPAVRPPRCPRRAPAAGPPRHRCAPPPPGRPPPCVAGAGAAHRQPPDPTQLRVREHYLRLLHSIGQSGIFHALLVLPDGKVVDGQHRYFCAQELGLESVPVRIIDLALPLGDADQLAIEDWAVYDVITRRHLTKV